MRTNIVIDDEMIETAKKLTGLLTKKAVVEEALCTLIRLKRQERILSFRGKIYWEGNLDESRKARIHAGRH